MATAKKNEAVKVEANPVETGSNVQDTVIISVNDAEKIYDLFFNVESADAHFHTCQSVNFRQHVQSVYKAPNISKAFEALKTAIDKAKGE